MKRRIKYLVLLVVISLFIFQSAYAACLQCVRYVKNTKPAYDKYYPVKKDGKPTSQKACWFPANDLWINLWVVSRGSTPKVGSVFIIEKNFTQNTFYESCLRMKTVTMDVGHTGIVTGVYDSGKKIKVTHANWDVPCGVSTGYFVRSSTSTSYWQYIKSNGVKWSKYYKILGFVYTP